jgi:hypothetical protein
MAHLTPTTTSNLDQYGNEAIDWERVRAALEDSAKPGADSFTVLGTARPDGRPHAAPVGALWIDGAYHVVSGDGTQKSRNLASNPACTLTARLPGIDLVFEGVATRVIDPGELARVAEAYQTHGWPAEVDGDALTAPYTAPSGGPPPWPVYRIAASAATGVATAEPYGATRWLFDS